MLAQYVLKKDPSKEFSAKGLDASQRGGPPASQQGEQTEQKGDMGDETMDEGSVKDSLNEEEKDIDARKSLQSG